MKRAGRNIRIPFTQKNVMSQQYSAQSFDFLLIFIDSKTLFWQKHSNSSLKHYYTLQSTGGRSENLGVQR